MSLRCCSTGTSANHRFEIEFRIVFHTLDDGEPLVVEQLLLRTWLHVLDLGRSGIVVHIACSCLGAFFSDIFTIVVVVVVERLANKLGKLRQT